MDQEPTPEQSNVTPTRASNSWLNGVTANLLWLATSVSGVSTAMHHAQGDTQNTIVQGLATLALGASAGWTVHSLANKGDPPRK
jgi:hypothetical protein